jgi:hypothetical protein
VGIIAAVLLIVALVEYINHSFRVGIARVGFVGRAVVNHGLINRIRGLVREYASGKARHKLRHFEVLATFHNVVVNKHILSVKFDLVF